MTEPEAVSGRVAFSISPELRRRCEAVIAAMRAAVDRREHLDELTEVVVALTETGLDFYFLYPLELAGVGPMTRGTARVGIAAARRSIPAVIRRVLGSMSDEQLLAIADFMDEILVR